MALAMSAGSPVSRLRRTARRAPHADLIRRPALNLPAPRALGGRGAGPSADLPRGNATMFRMILAGAAGWMLATRPELRERVLNVTRDLFARLTAR